MYMHGGSSFRDSWYLGVFPKSALFDYCHQEIFNFIIWVKKWIALIQEQLGIVKMVQAEVNVHSFYI